MKLDLTSTKINQLLGRKELKFRIDEHATPNRIEVRREIAVVMRTEPEKVIIRALNTISGSRVVTGVAHVYNDVATLEKVEQKYIIARNTGIKEAQKTKEKTTQ